MPAPETPARHHDAGKTAEEILAEHVAKLAAQGPATVPPRVVALFRSARSRARRTAS